MSIRFGAFFLISSLCPGGRRGPVGWGRRTTGSAAAQALGALAPPALPPSSALEINFLLLSFPLLWCLCVVTPPRDVGLAPLPCHPWPTWPWPCPLAGSLVASSRHRGGLRPPQLSAGPAHHRVMDGERSHRCSPAASFSLISLGGLSPTSITLCAPPPHQLLPCPGPRACDEGLPTVNTPIPP